MRYGKTNKKMIRKKEKKGGLQENIEDTPSPQLITKRHFFVIFYHKFLCHYKVFPYFCRRLIDKLLNISKMTGTPKILIIYTGGTIGMGKDANTGVLEPLDFNHLVSSMP